MSIQLIIPMSGIGKRFVDAGYTDPKPLIEVDGHPIIKHVVDLFPGVTDVSFICNENHIKETNMRDILESISPGCKIYEVSNDNRKGPVDAVYKIKEQIKDDSEVIISYCDYGTKWSFDEFLNEIRTKNLDGCIPSYTGFHPHMLGSDNYAFCKEDNKNLIEIKEKESFTNNRMDEYASNGTYYFKSGILVKKYFQELMDLNINIKGEYYVSLVYNLLVRDGLKVGIFEIEKMLQWGTPYDVEIYNSWSRYFKNIKESPQKKVKNSPGTTLILPMAGRGTRFSEYGYNLPKPLLPIDNQSMFLKAVDNLPISDFNIFITLEEHEELYSINKLIKDNFKNADIINLTETTEGQACTCELAIRKKELNLELPIMISACDNGVYYDSDKYLQLLDDESIDIIVWTFRNNQSSKNNPDMYAWIEVDDDNNALYVSCKKFIYDDPLNTHAIIGTMFFRKSKYFLEGLNKNYKEGIKTNNEFYVDDILNQNIKSGLKVKIFEVRNYICWGTPDDYKTYNYWNDFFDKNKN